MVALDLLLHLAGLDPPIHPETLLSDVLKPCFQTCSDLAFRLVSSKLKFEIFSEEHGDDTRAYLSRSKGTTAMEGYPFACGCINVCFTLMEVFHPPTQHVGRAIHFWAYRAGYGVLHKPTRHVGHVLPFWGHLKQVMKVNWWERRGGQL